jgi:AcrR family transcriptional regulator
MWYMPRQGEATDVTPKERLLAAVIDHVADRGIADLSLRQLAAAIGTSHRMLIHHFGSKDGLLVEVIRTVEAQQRAALAELQADAGGSLEDVGRRFWERISDPSLDRQERLFFEVYGQALQGRAWAVPLLDGIVDDWIGPVAAMLGADGLPAADARAHARLGLAVARGLLLDLLATGDRAGVDAAMARFQDLLLRNRR